MKRKIQTIIVLLNMWRLLIPSYVYIRDSEFRNKINMDLERLKIGAQYVSLSLWGLLHVLVRMPIYRAIFYFRMKNYKVLRKIEKILLPVKTPIEISGDINGGFVVYHGHSCVIHCQKAGENFSVYQNVTVGRNKEHYSSTGTDKPVFGNNVSLYPGCVVAGGITIGNNVEIAANSVVLNDVPDDSLVVGNPARIVRIGNTKIDVLLRNYAR